MWSSHGLIAFIVYSNMYKMVQPLTEKTCKFRGEKVVFMYRFGVLVITGTKQIQKVLNTVLDVLNNYKTFEQ